MCGQLVAFVLLVKKRLFIAWYLCFMFSQGQFAVFSRALVTLLQIGKMFQMIRRQKKIV